MNNTNEDFIFYENIHSFSKNQFLTLSTIKITDTVLVFSKLKNKRNRTATATKRFKVFCDI